MGDIMQLYRLKICPLSSFCSRLHSDTFFGAFCWSYKYLYSEQELEKLLQLSVNGTPQVVFSNAFPENAFPLPMGIVNLKKDFLCCKTKQEGKINYQLNKRLKKAEYITISAFYNLVQEGFSKEKINVSEIENSIVESNIVEYDVIRNMVSRDAGIVENQDGDGSLYAQTEYCCKPDTCFDVYIYSAIEEEKLKAALDLMFLLGIGGKKSTGKGRFTVNSLERIENFGNYENANAYVLLSNYIPAKTDSSHGFYSTFVKNSVLDREFSRRQNPYKKPYLFVKSGAVFFLHEGKVQEVYGRCAAKVSEEFPLVVESGYAIAIPIYVKEENNL